MKVFNKTLLLTAITLASTSTMAIDVALSGFGTLGFSQNNEDGQVVNGAKSRGSWGQTTVLGLQADAKLTNRLSATVQVKLSEDAIDDERMQMTLQMAFLGFQATESLKFRIGRLRAPVYLDSEYLDVGYVKTTATAPLAVYGQAPFSNYNGVDMIFTHYTESDLEFQLQPYYGRERAALNLSQAGTGNELDANFLAGLNISLAGDDWKVRAGYTIGEMNNPNYQPTPHPNPAAAAAIKTAQDAAFLNDDMASFLTVGANYDDGNLLATVEFAKRSIEDATTATNLTGIYTTIGYRFGAFTPYFTYQAQETDDKNREIGLNSDFKGLSLGAKYDFSKVALKAEVTHYEFGKGAATFGYTNTVTGNATSTLKSAKVLTLTLETVF